MIYLNSKKEYSPPSKYWKRSARTWFAVLATFEANCQVWIDGLDYSYDHYPDELHHHFIPLNEEVDEMAQLLYLYDDLDLPLGKTRLREKGSAGGHNGMKSIINHTQTDSFKRVRVGIDKNPLIETKNYVLGKFSKNEMVVVNETIDKVSNIIQDFINGVDFLQIMNKYN